jgi:hypothetical protein
MATTMLARLDSLGRDARIPQLVAHVQMRNTAVMVNFDTTALMREDKALRAVIATLTPDERLEYKSEVGAIMTDSVILAWTRRESPLPTVVHRLLQQELAARGPSGYSEKEIRGVMGWIELLASQVGKPAPPVTGKFWFPADSPHVQPAPGKVTLLIKVQKDQGLMSARMAMLRRLYNQYHDRGLDIVLVLQTEGFSWSSPPQSPADEAKTIAWYYYDFLKLPFKVVVDETPFTTKPDGRRVSGQIAFNRQYVLPQVIVGRDGRIFTLWIGLESESQMRAYIEQALAAPTPVLATQ